MLKLTIDENGNSVTVPISYDDAVMKTRVVEWNTERSSEQITITATITWRFGQPYDGALTTNIIVNGESHSVGIVAGVATLSLPCDDFDAFSLSCEGSVYEVPYIQEPISDTEMLLAGVSQSVVTLQQQIQEQEQLIALLSLQLLEAQAQAQG